MNGNLKIGPFSLFLLLILSVWSCTNTPELEEESSNISLETLIPGTWEAVSMQVNVYSVDSIPDSSYVFRINDGDWETLFSVPPPRTFFEKDNKYRIEYRDKLDGLTSMDRGIWNVMGDTLMMIQPDQTFQYKAKYDKGLLYLIGLRDWDEDGAVDDSYQEVKRRVSIGTD